MDRQSALRILIADDEDVVHQTIGSYLRDVGHEVESVHDGRVAWQAVEGRSFDLALVDVRMPGMEGFSLLEKSTVLHPEMPVVIVTGHADLDMAVRALRLGAADFLTKPVRLPELDAVLEKCLRLRGLRRDKRRLHATIRRIQSPGYFVAEGGSLVGTSPATCRLRQQIEAAVEAVCETILITGETGTGKEVTAREIHLRAAAPEDPFVAVSCPAMPDALVESELFGHVKGAFTGATEDRIGCFEQADGSTIFLDEVGDLSLAAQAKILRVLETRILRRVGGSQEISVKVRVIAATNADLESHVRDRTFRRDLFYRLNVYSIHLAPLRTRREDILPLAEHFLEMYAAPRALPIEGFAADAREKLWGYDYPGNARELRYLVERAAILCRSGQIRAEHLGVSEALSAPAAPVCNGDEDRRRILGALEESKWNCRHAAETLAMPYSTFRYRMQKLGITK